MKTVHVVGAGIGGLAAALALAKRGHRVTVFEQAPELSEVGAGIQISPNGLAVLTALGVADDLITQSMRAQAVELRDYKRAGLVARLDLDRYAPDLTYIFAHRHDVISTLYEACKSLNVDVHFGERLVRYEAGTVEFASGLVSEADVIIGADGLHSRLRSSIASSSEPFFTGQVAYRAVVDNVIDQSSVATIHMAPNAHIVSYPVRDGRKLNLVMVREQDQWIKDGWRNPVEAAEVQQHFSQFQGPIAGALAEVQDVFEWGLFRYPVADKWHNTQAVLLGDAAHPTLPFMAQGANLALEDAWVLTACLSAYPETSEALAHYQSRRHPRVTRIVNAASKAAWKYHLAAWPLRTSAHLAMSTLSKVAPRKMVSQFDWIYRHDVTKD